MEGGGLDRVDKHIEDSIVLIVADLNPTNWEIPWMITKKSNLQGQGSGFCIELPDIIKTYQKSTKPVKLKKYIVTNAHCIEDTRQVFIKKHKSAKWTQASVLAILHECDLAILDVASNNKFLIDVPALHIDKIPGKSSTVYAMGYPLGGFNISITSGIISRLVIKHYTDVTRGVAIQIDVPINPGNSGGPVVNSNGGLIGIVRSIELSASNMSYMIPTMFLEYFINLITRGMFTYDKSNKTFTSFVGFPNINMQYQHFYNDIMREYYSMPKDATGVLIVQSNEKKILPGDILMSINDVPVYNDGTMLVKNFINMGDFLSDDVLPFDTVINMFYPKDKIAIKLFRDGAEINISIMLESGKLQMPLLPNHLLRKPSYYFLVGMTFVPVSFMLIQALEAENRQAGILRTETGDSVVMTNLYEHNATTNFPFNLSIVHSVNSIPITSLSHMVKVVDSEKKKSKYVVILFKNIPDIVILKSADIDKNNAEIADELNLTKFYEVGI